MEMYLRPTDIIDWQIPVILNHAKALSADTSSPIEIARICFEWVRDHIQHSGDYEANITTCLASEVMIEGTGWCFAKSHLLAALLRANSIPAGLCYQRLSRDDGNGFTLHGLNAVHLPELGWYRIDARGNKPGVDAQFCPPKEMLAFYPQADGEFDFYEIWPDPVPIVLDCLTRSNGWAQVFANLPDIAMIKKS
ncbi:MAG: transglutaminase family protein [Proteobacteria bacterium]|nr:transglutaminase family protein [Pseudomonadota bacterium]